jgi:hypothetical protein
MSISGRKDRQISYRCQGRHLKAPVAPKLSAPKHIHHVSFDLSQDLPGNLSRSGSRHDNDHASISDIQALPTAQEITSNREEYLPSIDPTKHHLPGLAGLVDGKFRRERKRNVCRTIIRSAIETAANRPTAHFRIDLCRNGMTQPAEGTDQNSLVTNDPESGPGD